MTRSGRCFKPDNLKTDGNKEKDKEKGKGKENTDAFLKEIQRSEQNAAEQFSKAPAKISILGLLLTSE